MEKVCSRRNCNKTFTGTEHKTCLHCREQGQKYQNAFRERKRKFTSANSTGDENIDPNGEKATLSKRPRGSMNMISPLQDRHEVAEDTRSDNHVLLDAQNASNMVKVNNNNTRKRPKPLKVMSSGTSNAIHELTFQ
jgi:hypothetical protein